MIDVSWKKRGGANSAPLSNDGRWAAPHRYVPVLVGGASRNVSVLPADLRKAVKGNKELRGRVADYTGLQQPLDKVGLCCLGFGGKSRSGLILKQLSRSDFTQTSCEKELCLFSPLSLSPCCKRAPDIQKEKGGVTERVPEGIFLLLGKN
ncbi:hypothetical protein QQF64_014721 [Cirrhinus molitorella]|uniref:Uncharacterized protein n=1 Tax=Cirrhinus molitorella TaxID=172907 RepID=A0ABR3NSX4_9TELE